jgi:NADH-quinone oxidoreductase subunit M
MTIHLSIVVFLPLAAAIVAAFLPARIGRWLVVAGSVAVLGYAIAMIADFDRDAAGLQYVTDDTWIAELGIRYQLGVDGLNLFLIALTALLWVPAMHWAAELERDRQRTFLFHMALGETAVLGAFCAQDLALFVVFFDLMLVPFYFLIGGWGIGDRVAATTKFVIYTLVGSLLMLAGAVALGVLTASESGNDLTFNIAQLAQNPLPEGTQQWIFLLFAAAFLVKAPAFPFHGWVVDTYRATPTPVLVVLSAVLSKVGVYAFLRIVLPVMPDASVHFQDPMLVIAVFSILYGSVLAFSQDEPRLVVAYSSIAQLGFILLGIFAIDDLGAQGALMQMVNHGLVAGALFFIIATLTLRAGSPSLAQMGGMAMRAPVLAGLFLVVILGTLAMPGSPNFVGEILILFGALDTKLVYALVASVGVALAAVYAIRVFQRAMHNRSAPGIEGGDLTELDFAVIAPLVAVIVALGVYPQLILDRTEEATKVNVAAAAKLSGGSDKRAEATEFTTTTRTSSHITETWTDEDGKQHTRHYTPR